MYGGDRTFGPYRIDCDYLTILSGFMKVLITGGAGFIGSHARARLEAFGHDCVVLDSIDPQVHGPLAAEARPAGVIVADVRDRDALRSALVGCEAVVHLAARVGVGQSMYEIASYVEVNALGTARLLQEIVEAGSVRRLVVASSMAAYGEGAYDCPRCRRDVVAERDARRIESGDWEPGCPTCGSPLRARPTPESWPTHPRSVYAITKRDQEDLTLRVGQTYGITSMALRFFNVYGPGQALSNPYTGVAAIFASRLLNNHPPRIYEDGAQTRDLVHVADAAEAVRLAVEADAPSGVFNVGTGRGVPIAEVARMLASKLNRDCPPDITGEYRAGDVRHCIADISAAAAKLGYRPRVQLEDGLDDIVATPAGDRPRDRFDAMGDELRRRGVVTPSRPVQV